MAAPAAGPARPRRWPRPAAGRFRLAALLAQAPSGRLRLAALLARARSGGPRLRGPRHQGRRQTQGKRAEQRCPCGKAVSHAASQPCQTCGALRLPGRPGLAKPGGGGHL